MRDSRNTIAIGSKDSGTHLMEWEDMVQEEDGLLVIDLAAQVEGLSFADSGNKEGGAGFEPVGLVLSICRRIRCYIIEK